MALVDDLQEVADLSRSAYSGDPRLRACFASADRIAEVVAGSRDAQRLLETAEGRAASLIYGLLTVEWGERKVLGTALEGDQVRREVARIAVNFAGHRFVGVAASEQDCRWELKKRAFDFLVEQALADLASQRDRRSGLERQRHLLGRKLSDLRAGNWGLEEALGGTGAGAADLGALEQDLAAVESELASLGTNDRVLERNLERVAVILDQPADLLDRRTLRLRMDQMGFKVQGDSDTPSGEVVFTELFSGAGLSRVALLGAFPAMELPERPDVVREALRYLG
jgi:hypothetical protein